MAEHMYQAPLTTTALYETLCRLLPRQNDFSPDTDYATALKELQDFDIVTEADLLALVEGYKEDALAIDAEPIEETHIGWYKKEYGEAHIEDCIKNRYWYDYAGLLRIMLELAFGDRYTAYANKRDGVE